ncbi:MAG: N-acetylneuraminate synthase [bacterium]
MNKVFIIAEAGVNHNGDLSIAKKMIDVAKNCGVDAIKFQTFKAEKLVSKFAKKAEYQKQSTDKNESQYEMIKKLELDVGAHKELLAYSKKRQIMFLSTPFDLDSIDMLNDLGLKIFKISSGDMTNLPYLRKIGALGKKIIMSSGMSNLNEVKEAVAVLVKAGTPKADIVVLHCNTEYPTSYSDVNLMAMLTIKKELDITIGYSDHTLGIEVPIAAVALGATVIEKHFTLDKTMQGPDHKASLDPTELASMVRAIRNLELSFGNGEKVPSKSELSNMKIARKSIVAIKNIKKGDKFSENNIGVKRPGDGISPMKWDTVLGLTAKKDFAEDELIEL